MRCIRALSSMSAPPPSPPRPNPNQWTSKLVERPAVADLLQALAVPPPSRSFTGLGAWVEHTTAPRDGMVSDIIEETLQLPREVISRLFSFGGIYTAPIPPPLPPHIANRLSSDALAASNTTRAAALLASGSTTASSSQPASHSPAPNPNPPPAPRRLYADAPIARHSYVRVHLCPKRFPSFYETDWAARVVKEGDNFVVLNKPPALPVAPTADNALESALAGAALGVKRSSNSSISTPGPLLITSRLDQGTEGLVVLGKNAEFVRRFNAIVGRNKGDLEEVRGKEEEKGGGGGQEGQRRDRGAAKKERQEKKRRKQEEREAAEKGGDGDQGNSANTAVEYRKVYRALVATRPELAPGTVVRQNIRVRCRRPGTPYFSLILQGEEGSNGKSGGGNTTTAAAAAATASYPEHALATRSSKLPKVYNAEMVVLGVEEVTLGPTAAAQFGLSTAFEVPIELVTGRTHQIRAQMSALGHPLLGDDLYGPLADAELRGRIDAGDETLAFVDGEGRRLLSEPEGPIGLQAHVLEISAGWVFGLEQGAARFEAGPPWWRQ